jgi:Predicted nucleotide-binding protein containing TIR-like domain
MVDTPLEINMNTITSEEGRSPRFKYLVLLPFDGSTMPLRDTIGDVIRRERGEPIFLDEIRFGAVWVDEIAGAIGTSDAVIAEVTRLNPNVMFELGMAHSLGKPLVLLLSEAATTNLPSDLSGYQYLTYTPGDLTAFSERLGKAVRQLAQRRGAY